MGFVTVTVVEALATMVATALGDQVGVPHVNAGDSSPGAGGTSWTAHVIPAGSPPTVALAPLAMVTLPWKPVLQLYSTVKLGVAPPR